MSSSKFKLTVLETVYPPISNQEAVWLQCVPDVEAALRQSDFYMIAGRAEAKFVNLLLDPNAEVLDFDFRVGVGLFASVHLDLRRLPAVADFGTAPIWIEAGEKVIRVWDGPELEKGSNVLEWFTTEKILWDRARGRAGIEGLDNLRELATYDLLYVGIAKRGDSFDRLLARGHKARQEILANEPQRYPGARVTDETYLFMFRANPLVMQTFEPDHDFTQNDLSLTYDAKRIVADAEKAFVSLLKPKYNIEKFANYPKGTRWSLWVGLYPLRPCAR